MITPPTILTLIRCAALALTAAGCGVEAPRIAVEQARLVATANSAAGYLTLVNSGGADRLIAIDAPGVGRASLHSTIIKDGVMRMRAIQGGLRVGAGSSVELAPMGNHVMIEGIVRPLTPGSEVELILRFERQGAVKAMARVEAPGASAMAH